MLRQRGILLPAFDIYGGAKGLYDFGPVGGRLRSRLNQVWLDHWLGMGNVVEISCPTVTPYEVLEASGHVGEFSDFMTVCQQCNEASRADTLLESHHSNPDSLSKSELQDLLNQPFEKIMGILDETSSNLDIVLTNLIPITGNIIMMLYISNSSCFFGKYYE